MNESNSRVIHKISQLAEEIGLSPSREQGQNFLTDKGVLEGILENAGISADDSVLEIGPGFGVLTSRLVDSGADVLAIESEARLAEFLENRFSGKKNFSVLRQNVLKVSSRQIARILGEDFRVVSNIPYHITGKIIKKFVSSELPKPSSCFFLIQKEVASRICAGKGSMNLLSLSVQLYARPRVVFNVSKRSFWPAPEVDSSLLAIDGIHQRAVFDVNEDNFWRIARIGFSSPRKQLKNNLAAGLRIKQERVARALSSCGIFESARAQELDINDWVCLSRSENLVQR